jgi:tetratricopeptide (TPR) repeat protein
LGLERRQGSSLSKGWRHRLDEVHPGGKQEYNFFILVSVPSARGQLHEIPGVRTIGTCLKEKDTNMNGPARITALAVALAGMVVFMSGCDKLAARDQLNKGVDAYKGQRYEEAIGHFQKTAQQAIGIFQEVLDKDPSDVNSLKQIAGIYFSIKKLDDAKAWQKKVLAVDPKDPEAAYTVGVIDWTEAHENMLKALSPAGVTDDGEGNAKAPKPVMEPLKGENGPLVEEGLQYLNQAVANRPNYDDAMAYLNLIYRRKADVDFGDETARKADVAAAEDWRQKAMGTRKANEEKKNKGPGGITMDASGNLK